MPRPAGPSQPSAGQHPAPKVAIPRLPNPYQDRVEGRDGSSGSDSKRRVARACTRCRIRKIKCTGEQPRCAHCVSEDMPCEYTSSRKDRLKIVTEHNIHLIQLLEHLNSRVSDEDRQKIDEALAKVEPEVASAASALNIIRKGRSALVPEHGESHVSASVGSNEDADLLDEDVHRNDEARATGFLGRASVVQWLKSLQQDMDRDMDGSVPGGYGPPGSTDDAIAQRVVASHNRLSTGDRNLKTVRDTTFYLDCEPVTIDFDVQTHALPSMQMAGGLVDCYMRTLQSSFPILPKITFQKEVKDYFKSRQELTPTRVSNAWLASLNLVFAIGARYSYLAGAPWAEENDHLIYHSRAHILSAPEQEAFFRHPSIRLVRNAGLLALYYLTTGQISRSWIDIGVAIRLAQSLGLHVRNEDYTASEFKKETLARTWWSIYLVESILSVLTGRPSIITSAYCSVPLPLALSDDQLTEELISSRLADHVRSSLHLSPLGTTIRGTAVQGSQTSDMQTQSLESCLQARIQLGAITQDVLDSLYSPVTAVYSWEAVEKTISSLIKQLDVWLRSLPATLDFTKEAPDSGHGGSERIELGFQYFSVRILTLRPCLCRIEQRIEHQGSSSKDFDRTMARACVQSAKSLTDILPGSPVPIHLLKSGGPWWCIIHYMMQAIAVFLTEMSYGNIHLKMKEKDLNPYLKKLIRWLREMGGNNEVAHKAYKVAFVNLKAVAEKGRVEISDLLQEDASFVATPKRPFPGTGSKQRFNPNANEFQPQNPPVFGPGSGPSFPIFYDPTGTPRLKFSEPAQPNPFPSQSVIGDSAQPNQFFKNTSFTSYGQSIPASTTMGAQYAFVVDVDASMPDYQEQCDQN
ncbi:hypothetical protein GQ43DRAFT_476103 [Delitschia confertaspora ATCC 74209]|uniref:Zn(2)-C6 fungal-type domain-containing protein n=1 Tax=Delitschia confertaspora ATCC 74209 TaxID=1513339 RepID=A0A9P4JHM6_9PLEO|nr:hypothetical protein GQ43DRAFT_476103 [Delitschia confertaspora ATCC 74209]